MYNVGVVRNWQIRHALSGDFGDETIPHSHEYRVEWSLQVDALDDNGFAFDISTMQEKLDELIEDLNGKFLNDFPFFTGIQVSVENTCRYLSKVLMKGLTDTERSDIIRSEIRIWESETAWASFASPPGDFTL